MLRLWELPMFVSVKKKARQSLSDFLNAMQVGGAAAKPALNTITRSVAIICPGFGSPAGNNSAFLNDNIALSGTGQQTNTVPSTGAWTAPNTLSAGYVRVKISGGTGTSPTVTDLLITGSDGTITTELAVFHPNAAVAISTTSALDLLFPFFTDLTLTSITVKSTLGGTGPGVTMVIEVCGTSGSNPTQV